MSDNTQAENTQVEDAQTVQKYRHSARRVLTEARSGLALRTEGTGEVYRLLNGTIESVIQGRQGLSQEQQVANLEQALTTARENREVLADKVEAARAEILEQIEGWGEDFTTKMDEAIATLEEAREFAASRDFDAHQQRKVEAREAARREAEAREAERRSNRGEFYGSW